MSYESGEELGESIHRDAARLVASYWPRSEDDERVIDAGFQASELGYWSLDWLYTHHGLGYLLGEAVDELALFSELDPLLDLAKLSVAWNTGFERYEYVLERLALNG